MIISSYDLFDNGMLEKEIEGFHWDSKALSKEDEK